MDEVQLVGDTPADRERLLQRLQPAQDIVSFGRALDGVCR